MEKVFRIGVIGTGRAAAYFTETVASMDGVKISAVYNPDKEKVEEFAARYAIEYSCGDTAKLWDKCDAVYIAVPHELHAPYIKEALRASKHILCGKPLAMSESHARSHFDEAKEKGLVLMEVLPTAFTDGYRALLDTVKSGSIGQVMDVECSYTRLTPTNCREMRDSIYGGSMTELSSYVLLPIFGILGSNYNSVSFHSLYASNGVDTYTKAYFDYGKATATAKMGLEVKSAGELLVSGTKGYIKVADPWWKMESFEIIREDQDKPEIKTFDTRRSGLEKELIHFVKLVRQASLFGLASALKEDDRVYTRLKENTIVTADCFGKFLEERFRLGEEHKSEVKDVKIWAHRGCSMAYPENTLEALRAAAKLRGLTGIEFDIQMSRDGEVVVFHDENVRRMTEGFRDVKDCKLSELRALTIRSVEGTRTTIITLEEALRCLKPYCISFGLLLNIELKTSVYRYEGIEEKAMALVRKYSLEKYVIWSSFLVDSLKVIKELDANAKVAVLAYYIEDCISGAKKVGAEALHPCVAGLNVRVPKYLGKLPIRAWNSDEPLFNSGEMLKEIHLDDYASFGVTDIFTNVPEMYIKRKPIGVKSIAKS